MQGCRVMACTAIHHLYRRLRGPLGAELSSRFFLSGQHAKVLEFTTTSSGLIVINLVKLSTISGTCSSRKIIPEYES